MRNGFVTMDDWKDNPIGLYTLLQSERKQFILRGFPHNLFSIAIPLVEEALDNIRDLFVQDSTKPNPRFILNGVEELTQEFSTQIREVLDEAERLKKGKVVKSLSGEQETTVLFPYKDTLDCATKYALIAEQVQRYKFYKNLLIELQANHPTYLAQEVENLRIILDSTKPTVDKLDEFVAWDKAYTEKKLRHEGKPHDTFHTNKAMHIPGYFQRQYKKLVMEDLVDADTIDAVIIPSFAPLDLDFFNKTRVAPVYVMGLIDFSFIFADGYRHTCHEFAFHDLKHAWDMELFRIKSAADRDQSLPENMMEQAKNADFIFSRLKSISNPAMQECITFLLFELVHEEGHSYNLNDLKDGLENPSIYCNDFLSRVASQKLITHFFSEKKFMDYVPLMQRGKQILLDIIDDAYTELDIPRNPRVSYTSNHHGFCEVLHGEPAKPKSKQITVDHEQYVAKPNERFVTPNISLRPEQPNVQPSVFLSTI